MRDRTQSSEREGARDVGTLWTMHRHGMTARCALLAWRRAWEIRVVVDGATLLTQRCQRPNDAFQLAECWRLRLLEQRWQQVVPGSAAGEMIARPTRVPTTARRPAAGGRSWRENVPTGE